MKLTNKFGPKNLLNLTNTEFQLIDVQLINFLHLLPCIVNAG